eukprot:g6080.t1
MLASAVRGLFRPRLTLLGSDYSGLTTDGTKEQPTTPRKSSQSLYSRLKTRLDVQDSLHLRVLESYFPSERYLAHLLRSLFLGFRKAFLDGFVQALRSAEIRRELVAFFRAQGLLILALTAVTALVVLSPLLLTGFVLKNVLAFEAAGQSLVAKGFEYEGYVLYYALRVGPFVHLLLIRYWFFHKLDKTFFVALRDLLHRCNNQKFCSAHRSSGEESRDDGTPTVVVSNVEEFVATLESLPAVSNTVDAMAFRLMRNLTGAITLVLLYLIAGSSTGGSHYFAPVVFLANYGYPLFQFYVVWDKLGVRRAVYAAAVTFFLPFLRPTLLRFLGYFIGVSALCREVLDPILARIREHPEGAIFYDPETRRLEFATRGDYAAWLRRGKREFRRTIGSTIGNVASLSSGGETIEGTTGARSQHRRLRGDESPMRNRGGGGILASLNPFRRGSTGEGGTTTRNQLGGMDIAASSGGEDEGSALTSAAPELNRRWSVTRYLYEPELVGYGLPLILVIGVPGIGPPVGWFAAQAAAPSLFLRMYTGHLEELQRAMT